MATFIRNKTQEVRYSLRSGRKERNNAPKGRYSSRIKGMVAFVFGFLPYLIPHNQEIRKQQRSQDHFTYLP